MSDETAIDEERKKAVLWIDDDDVVDVGDGGNGGDDVVVKVAIATTVDRQISDDDVERQEEIKALQAEDNSEPLEKVKEKPPPGINASLVMIYAIYFSMFTIGWVNLNSCPVSRLIPIYLIVAGFVGALGRFLSETTNRYIFNVAVVLVIFYCVWHVLGSWWIYREYQPNYQPELGKYCDRTTYLLAFWMLTLQYTLLSFSLMLNACTMLMKGSFRKIK